MNAWIAAERQLEDLSQSLFPDRGEVGYGLGSAEVEPQPDPLFCWRKRADAKRHYGARAEREFRSLLRRPLRTLPSPPRGAALGRSSRRVASPKNQGGPKWSRVRALQVVSLRPGRGKKGKRPRRQNKRVQPPTGHSRRGRSL
jgi:hypothetical protein